MKISVCMATYNGVQFIREQIESILPQLSTHDELVIVDDASTDRTVAMIESLCDDRIRIIKQTQNRGVIQTFARALEESRGNLIFLADQDDVWHPNKVHQYLQIFNDQPAVTLVLSDYLIINEIGVVTGKSNRVVTNFYPGIIRTLIKNQYHGSAMALRRNVLPYCLPFPAAIPMHDMWIGIANRFVGDVVFLNEPLLFYRRHGSNVSPAKHAPLAQMIRWRWALLRNLILLCLRKNRYTTR